MVCRDGEGNDMFTLFAERRKTVEVKVGPGVVFRKSDGGVSKERRNTRSRRYSASSFDQEGNVNKIRNKRK